MKLNLLRQLYFMSRLTFFGIVIQTTLCGLLVAGDINAQFKSKSLDEITWNQNVSGASLADVLITIQAETGFVFALNETLVDKNQKVNLKFKRGTLGDLLRVISKEYKVKFKRINNQIHVAHNPDSEFDIEEDYGNIIVDVDISGKVVDEKNESLPGATIVEKGTTNGTTTDLDGNYKLSVPDGATITISFVGYETQEVVVGNQSVIDVQMEVDAAQLDEVLVVGYGTQRKRDVVGAISSVKSEELVMSSTASIGHALKGKVAGLQIRQNSAQPGGGLDILIRGAASINASNEPLIVIDGFPITNLQQPASGNRYDGGTQSIFNSFNPNDIESVEVLKDASATAIYGARAANGVILITTKKGLEGDVKVEYSSSFSYQKYNDSYDTFDKPEWMKLRNEAAWEQWSYINRVYPYSDKTLEEANADPVNGIPFKRFYSDAEIRNADAGTDWLSLVTRDGTIQQHNVSVRGGSKTTKYLLSGNYFNQNGVMQNSAFERYSFRLNIDQELNKYVNFGIKLSASKINNQNTQLGDAGFEQSGIIRSAIQQGPHIEAIDEFGNYPINPDNALEPNPYSLLTISDEGGIDRRLTNFYLEVKPFEGLTARVQTGIDQGLSTRNTYLPRTTLWGNLENGRASVRSEEKNDNLLDFTLNYSRSFNEDHSLNALVGYSQQTFNSEAKNAGNNDFITDAFLWNNLNAGAGTKVVGSTKSKNKFVSYFGRLNYVFKDKYILTATVRKDGASVFADNNKYGIFPSAAIGWNIADEAFMSGVSDKISQLKLRLSHGQTGNADIGGNAFAAYYAQPAYLNPNESPIIGVFASRLDNPDLKWETTTETNLGLDFDFYRGRVSGSLEIYNREISDLLTEKPINAYHEVNTVWANIGKTQSKGVELTLSTVNINKQDFKWRSTFTFSRYRDRWKERAPDWKPSIFENADDPIRSQFFYLSDGIMQIGETVAAQPTLLPGQIKLQDLDGFKRDAFGDPVVDENGRFIKLGEPDGIIDQADQVLKGSSDPGFIAGFSNTLRYKNFELNFHFNGMFGRSIEDRTDLVYGVTADGTVSQGYNALKSVLNRWTPENPSTTRPSSLYGYSQYSAGDFFLQDAWFVRLQYLSLSYNIPNKLFGNVISNGAIRFDAQNLFLITPYNGIDPETDGIIAAYPNVRTFTLGIDLKF
ncbi:TonB-dependent receptor [Reichenbachiella sp. MALMAid0571]|uniref:SusC/RagA family TonB-linked outer membrane protein n=1 Tax=Reichenbachiella sp. MALMAid0571 TaxID=3143939 RepID=UPI0032DF626D